MVGLIPLEDSILVRVQVRQQATKGSAKEVSELLYLRLGLEQRSDVWRARKTASWCPEKFFVATKIYSRARNVLVVLVRQL